MRLFRRKAISESDVERCPRCTEKVPEGVHECAMCGLDLRSLRPSSGVAQVEQTPSSG
jgi:rRNA maturation endonuclease Nob1